MYILYYKLKFYFDYVHFTYVTEPRTKGAYDSYVSYSKKINREDIIDKSRYLL